jgi:hypothetical protein
VQPLVDRVCNNLVKPRARMGRKGKNSIYARAQSTDTSGPVTDLYP